MKRLISTLFAGSLIALAPLLFGCADALPTEADGTVIMPLKVGNMWIGTETTYDRDGNLLGTRSDTITIAGMLNVGTETWYRTGGDALYVNRGDGLYTNNGCPGPIARYPAAADDTFNTLPVMQVLLPNSDDPIEQMITSKVFSISESIVVPAGTFRAHHYAPIIIEPKNAHFIREEHAYYVPDLGPVRKDEYAGGMTDGYLAKRWELVRAVLK